MKMRDYSLFIFLIYKFKVFKGQRNNLRDFIFKHII